MKETVAQSCCYITHNGFNPHTIPCMKTNIIQKIPKKHKKLYYFHLL